MRVNTQTRALRIQIQAVAIELRQMREEGQTLSGEFQAALERRQILIARLRFDQGK